MIAALDIQVTKTLKSRLSEMDFNHLPFGKFYTDHMLEVDYKDGQWQRVGIRPFQALSMSPGLSAIHYGQSIFEGIKAYKDREGNPFIFRPFDNFKRFNLSAERMQMPVVPEEIFIEGMRRLVELDQDWIPMKNDYSLYIRPFMFSTDDTLGVKASDTYKFMILLSPTGPYYSTPLRIYVEEKYTRAARGGFGFAKAAGNYGGSMLATAVAKKQGFDQVLWMDAFEHKYIQEMGTMNVFFVIGDKVLTPDLEDGTILEGVTRDSAIEVLREEGYMVEEGPIHIDDVVRAYEAGELREAFGTGTAATISMIKELRYEDFTIKFDIDGAKVAPTVKRVLTDIREGRRKDTRGWMFKV